MSALRSRLADWAHWPFGLFYFPLFVVWLWYVLKSRSLWFFSASNPSIPFGGFEGESKTDIYVRLAENLYPKTLFVQAGAPVEDVLLSVQKTTFSFPLIVKPDIGMEGLLFRKLDSPEQLRRYHAQMPVDYLVQDFVEWPVEVSVFYYRYPNSATGTISGFIQKELGPSMIGNRYYGAVFSDLSSQVSHQLVDTFDEISKQGSFYYGRYDIKCPSVPAMIAEKKFIILEFNGAGSIPNHIYAGSYTLIEAYREIIRHWNILYEISRINSHKGIKYMPLAEGYRYLSRAKAHFRKLRKINGQSGKHL